MLLRAIIACIVFCCAVPLSASDVIFQIGRPDAMGAEFRHWIDWQNVVHQEGSVHRFVVGESRTVDWTPMHVSTRDMGNAGHSFQLEIEFEAVRDYPEQVYFVVGFCFSHGSEPSLIHVAVNGHASEPVRKHDASRGWQGRYNFNPQTELGYFDSVVIPIAGGAIQQGTNILTIRLTDGSWMFYDYLRLATTPEIPEQLPPVDLLTDFRAGPMQDVEEVLFVVRMPGTDPHWYANFGYFAHDENTFPFHLGASSWMKIMNVDTGEVRTIFHDPAGTIRDPQIHYDGDRVLFSYLPAGTRHFNLYEINIDGTGLRQLTFGDWDDIEPTYTASGDIIFVSSRARRWVQCWLTPVATLYKIGPNGENMRELSANMEHDNTPWPLPNGQILYTRWEYVDRSQLDYHHLWIMNPDGTRQQIFYGNKHPGYLMIGAKPVPNSPKVVASFSPGHGLREHYGRITLVSPRLGPDDLTALTPISRGRYEHADPWAFSEEAFMAVSNTRIELIDADGNTQAIYTLPEDLRDEGFWVFEPRPVIPREREFLFPDLTDPTVGTGILVLHDIYEGRMMETVERGSIKELLVLESLPKPIHYQGGMDQISMSGTFTLVRLVGTIPVEPDGSAKMELPANRAFFFVAMDHEDRPVKRMHSFTSVMSGEVAGCIGCHEHRTVAPPAIPQRAVQSATLRAPVRPVPIPNVPQVFDFVRDIQPILNRNCIECHHTDHAEAGIVLVGDWTPRFVMSYEALSQRQMFGDNRNRALSNFAPYEVGSSASVLLQLIDSNHHGVQLTDHERTMVRLWLDAGANYAGTYAANAHGRLGWVHEENWIRIDLDWQETHAMGEAIGRRCAQCHTGERALPRTAPESARRYGRVFNLSYPERSRMLTAPLAESAGGLGRCEGVVFADKDDPDFQTILAGIRKAHDYMARSRPNAETFFANRHYVREMIRFGVLPPYHDYQTMPICPFATDQKYWESLWFVPQARNP